LLTKYYVLYYESDIHYCKDHMHYAQIWQKMYDGWGELPKNIERVDCTTKEYNEVFNIKETPTRISVE